MSTDVSIIMGSDSDLSIMIKTCEILDELEVSYDVSVLSAHRTHDELQEFMEKANTDNRKVFIAAAGGAAHLGGVMAALTIAPVIAVPITSHLSGEDSLLSTVQMPSGIPVATMAINGSKNAGLMAAQILAIENKAIKTNLENFRKAQSDEVRMKNDKIKELGAKEYLLAYENNTLWK